MHAKLRLQLPPPRSSLSLTLAHTRRCSHFLLALLAGFPTPLLPRLLHLAFSSQLWASSCCCCCCSWGIILLISVICINCRPFCVVLLCAMIPKMSSTCCCCCCCCFYHSFSVIFIFIVASAWHTETLALSCCCSKIRCCFKCFLAAYTRYSK